MASSWPSTLGLRIFHHTFEIDFGDALGGELHETVVLASDALRGSDKNLAIHKSHKSNTAMMLAHPAAGQAMHMPNTMQGMMQFIGMAANMFNQQQQQTPPKET